MLSRGLGGAIRGGDGLLARSFSQNRRLCTTCFVKVYQRSDLNITADDYLYSADSTYTLLWH